MAIDSERGHKISGIDAGLFENHWVFLARAYLFDRTHMRGLAGLAPEFALIASESTMWTIEAKFAELPDSPINRQVLEPLATSGLDEIQLTREGIRNLSRQVLGTTGGREALADFARVLGVAERMAEAYDFVWVRPPIDFDAWEDIAAE